MTPEAMLQRIQDRLDGKWYDPHGDLESDIRSVLKGTTPEKQSVRILWGSVPEPGQEPITYEFATSAEFDAFIQGVEAAEGWLGYEVVPDDDDTD